MIFVRAEDFFEKAVKIPALTRQEELEYASDGDKIYREIKKEPVQLK